MIRDDQRYQMHLVEELLSGEAQLKSRPQSMDSKTMDVDGNTIKTIEPNQQQEPPELTDSCRGREVDVLLQLQANILHLEDLQKRLTYMNKEFRQIVKG